MLMLADRTHGDGDEDWQTSPPQTRASALLVQAAASAPASGEEVLPSAMRPPEASEASAAAARA